MRNNRQEPDDPALSGHAARQLSFQHLDVAHLHHRYNSGDEVLPVLVAGSFACPRAPVSPRCPLARSTKTPVSRWQAVQDHHAPGPALVTSSTRSVLSHARRLSTKISPLSLSKLSIIITTVCTYPLPVHRGTPSAESKLEGREEAREHGSLFSRHARAPMSPSWPRGFDTGTDARPRRRSRCTWTSASCR